MPFFLIKVGVLYPQCYNKSSQISVSANKRTWRGQILRSRISVRGGIGGSPISVMWVSCPADDSNVRHVFTANERKSVAHEARALLQ